MTRITVQIDLCRSRRNFLLSRAMVESGMKEGDIRPDEIFATYLSLATQDIEKFFHDAPLYIVHCPACGSAGSVFAFRKMGFDYDECSECNTLFVNPRPHEDAFRRYYADSLSVRYWATHFYKTTEARRREQIIRPKAGLVKYYLEKYLGTIPDNSCIVDIGAGYGVFCEELKALLPEGGSIIAVEPAGALEDVCRQKSLTTIPKFFEDISMADLHGARITAAVCFELIEHLHNPENFIRKCGEVLDRGALLILTTLTWDGFDLQVLRERSNSIHPPHHINFLTHAGIKCLLERHGFTVREITTPGKLDVDIVSKQVAAIKDPFIRKIVESDEHVRQEFQDFLQNVKLSSHMMVVAQKL